MNLEPLRNGQEIPMIIMADDTMFIATQQPPEFVDPDKMAQTVQSITVVMENGQMGGVPWFHVLSWDGHQSRWNGAIEVKGFRLEDVEVTHELG